MSRRRDEEAQMRAMVVPNYGGPEVFELRDLPVPRPGPDEVSIDVEFVSVNFTDVRNRRGDGLGVPPFVPGIEAAGRVREVGDGVNGLRPGLPVAAVTLGHAYAEVVAAKAIRIFPLPGHLIGDPVSAALLGVVATSLRLLRTVGRVRPSETMLVHGASGGVGTAFAQVARHLGLGPVYGTVGSPPKIDYARRYPFAGVFLRDHFRQAVSRATEGRGVDVVFDPMGGATRKASFEVLAPFGRLVHFGNASMEPEEAPDALTMRAHGWGYIGYSSGQHLQRDPEGTRSDYEEAIALVEDGHVGIDVTAVYPLEEAAEAHRSFERREALGKIVLAVR